MIATVRPAARRGQRTFVLAAFVLIGGLVGVTAPLSPARAQSFGDAPLSMRELNAAVNAYGYRLSGRPRRSGDAYVVEGVGPGGRRARLVIDAYDGALIRSTAVAASGAGETGARAGAGEPRGQASPFSNDGPRLVPPRDVPNVRRSVQDPGSGPVREREKREARREGDFDGPQRTPESRKARTPAGSERRGTAALPDKPDNAVGAPTEKIDQKEQVPDKAVGAHQSANEKERVTGQTGTVAPALLDEVEPRQLKDPPPMPKVVPLE